MKASLKHLTRQLKDEWDENLHLISMAHSKGPTSFGTTPEVAHFGREAPGCASILPSENTLRTKEQIAELHKNILELKKKQQIERQEHQSTKKDDRKDFRVGTLVYYYENPIRAYSAVEQRYSGPHEIVEMEKGSFSCIIENMKTQRRRKVQLANCKKVKGHPIPPFTDP